MMRFWKFCLGTALCAAAVAPAPAQDPACGLANGCPDLETLGSGLIAELVGFNLLPPGTTYFNSDFDHAPATVMLDHFELALLKEVLCNGGPLSQEAICAYDANLLAFRAEFLLPVVPPSAYYLMALFTISSDYHDADGVGLNGAYEALHAAKAAGEPLSAEGDLDGDGWSNQQEYDNVIAAGGDEAAYVAAATNPLLDGTAASAAALPLGGTPGMGLLCGLLACAGIVGLRRARA